MVTQLCSQTRSRGRKRHTPSFFHLHQPDHTHSHINRRERPKGNGKLSSFFFRGKRLEMEQAKEVAQIRNPNTLCPIMSVFAWLVLFRARLCVLTHVCTYKTHIGHNIFGFICGAAVEGFTNLPHLWNTTIRIIPIMRRIFCSYWCYCGYVSQQINANFPGWRTRPGIIYYNNTSLCWYICLSQLFNHRQTCGVTLNFWPWIWSWGLDKCVQQRWGLLHPECGHLTTLNAANLLFPHSRNKPCVRARPCQKSCLFHFYFFFH